MEVSPETSLQFQTTGQNSRQTLIISNTSQSIYAFKVKTTAPKLFVVRPNSGIMVPGDRVEVSLMLQQSNSVDSKRKDKFLVQMVVVPENFATMTEQDQTARVAEWWITKGDSIEEKKLRCNYLCDEVEATKTQSTGLVAAPERSRTENRGSIYNFGAEEALPHVDREVVVAHETDDRSKSLLKELNELKDRNITLQSTCDEYKKELARINQVRQRRADNSLPPTSTVGTVVKNDKKVSVQMLVILSFLSFLLGAWLI